MPSVSWEGEACDAMHRRHAAAGHRQRSPAIANCIFRPDGDGLCCLQEIVQHTRPPGAAPELLRQAAHIDGESCERFILQGTSHHASPLRSLPCPPRRCPRPVTEDGAPHASICDYHYRQLLRHRDAQSIDSLPARAAGCPAGSARRARRDTAHRSPPRCRASRSIPPDAFSEQTLELLQRAAEKAHELRRGELDSEHLYVLADNDIAAALLKELKLSAADIRAYIDEHAHTGTADPDMPLERMTVSPRLKKALQFAFRASHELGHSYVGPEHLLIGLAAVPDSIAGALLRKYGVTPEALRQKVVKVVGKGAEDGRIEQGTGTPHLDKVGRDLTAMARQGKLDPVLGRSQEIESTIEVLARRKKNNPVLIGEPGVGKTAIVEGLAQRIVNGDVPEVLRDKRLVEVNINAMVAGAKYRGEFEERAKQLIDEVTAVQDELILFVDELHTIVGAGQGGGEGGPTSPTC